MPSEGPSCAGGCPPANDSAPSGSSGKGTANTGDGAGPGCNSVSQRYAGGPCQAVGLGPTATGGPLSGLAGIGGYFAGIGDMAYCAINPADCGYAAVDGDLPSQEYQDWIDGLGVDTSSTSGYFAGEFIGGILTLPLGPEVGAGGEAADVSSAARNIATGPMLAKQLLAEESASPFLSGGELKPQIIAESREIINGSRLGNQSLRARLTADGSNIADWGKYETPSFRTPSGTVRMHFYYNDVIKEAYYGLDYKAIVSGMSRQEEVQGFTSGGTYYP